jgi:[ribosomal protein S5]-alanine N-acetyltransferase
VTAVSDELGTARLVLRPWTSAESSAVAEGARLGDWAADFPDASGVEHADWAAEAPRGPFGFRLVVERAPHIDGSQASPKAGLVVGSVGLEVTGDQAELFMGIVPSRRSRGYAAEAVRAVVAHAFADSSIEEVLAFVELANAASLRALGKAGFAHNGFPPVDGSAIFEVRRASDR